MKKYLTKSNILAVMVTLVLFGYIGITYYKLHKEKVIYVIGMCAKDASMNDHSHIKNADDIREAMLDDDYFFGKFQDCEILYNMAPKAMELKYPKN